MADITVTATSVVKGSGATIATNETFGETVTAGQAVYKSTTDGLIYKSDANSAAAAKTVYGVALNGGAVSQPASVLTAGPITIGATVAVGTIYVLSGTAGGIAPHGDLASGMTTCIIGVATSTTVINVNIFNSAAAVP